MKCTNPAKCDGEMKPLRASDTGAGCLECEKCGFRIDAPIQKAAPKSAPILPTENKGENN